MRMNEYAAAVMYITLILIAAYFIAHVLAAFMVPL